MPRRDSRRKRHSDDEPTAWELEVYRQYIEGEAQRDLAERFNVSQAHISNICGHVAALLKPHWMDQIDSVRSQNLQRLTIIIQREMAAWKLSQGEKVEVIESTGDGENSPSITTKTKRSSGDSNHHKTAIAAMQELSKQLGIEPPAAIGDGTLSSMGKTRKQLIAEILRSQQHNEDN